MRVFAIDKRRSAANFPTFIANTSLPEFLLLINVCQQRPPLNNPFVYYKESLLLIFIHMHVHGIKDSSMPI